MGLAEPAFAQSWTRTSAPITNWTAVASSADGCKLVAVVGIDSSRGNPGPIYTSADSGATWTMTSAPLRGWTCVASSADGTRLAAGTSGGSGGPIYTSVDSGATWIENDALPFYWSSIASSADGTNLAATAGVGKNGIPRVLRQRSEHQMEHPVERKRDADQPPVCILACLRVSPFGATGSLMACSWLGHGSLRACSPTPRLSLPPAMQFLPAAEDLSRSGTGPARAGA